MRPRRIVRRLVARARAYGTPHVHCPSCGGDAPVPPADVEQVCFVCHVRWARLELSGDEARDWSRVRAYGEASGARDWAAVWYPLLVDSPSPGGGTWTETLPCAFVYLLPDEGRTGDERPMG